ncbi:MAG: DUF2459 domain-containing protein [Cryomorphaceae bacterium]
MKIMRKILKGIVILVMIPLSYLLISLALSLVTVNTEGGEAPSNKSIYLTTNGVHLGIVMPKQHLDSMLLSGLKRDPDDAYFAFGWGDENFYLNTPTWADLTFRNAFHALFFKSSTLVHVTRYRQVQEDWIEVKLSETELEKLNTYVLETYALSEHGEKVILENQGYTTRDEFYKATGNYSFLKTCNTWVNTGFKRSGLKACYWTPFDFALIGKYE